MIGFRKAVAPVKNSLISFIFLSLGLVILAQFPAIKMESSLIKFFPEAEKALFNQLISMPTGAKVIDRMVRHSLLLGYIHYRQVFSDILAISRP